MSITTFLMELDWWKAFAVVWPPAVTLLVYWLSQRKNRSVVRRGPAMDLLKALSEAERAVTQFREKYERGYKDDDEFIADASSAFARCSDFLTKSKDIRTKILLPSNMVGSAKIARDNLVRELLAVRYGDKKTPFSHSNEYLPEVSRAKDAIYEQIRREI